VTAAPQRLEWQSAYLGRLMEADAEIEQGQHLVESFMGMLRDRKGAVLEVCRRVVAGDAAKQQWAGQVNCGV